MTRVRVAVLDYGSGNVRSAVRMLQRLGAQVELTVDPQAVLGAAGLFVPGVGNFHACVRGLRAVGGGRLIEQRLLQGRPVMGVCVGMQVLFDGSTEASSGGPEAGLGRWPGTVERLPADIVPHMGWSLVETARGSRLFAGVEDERFYFVHSYGVLHWGQPSDGSSGTLGPDLTWAQHGARFVAAVESGPLVATQFHPEKSGDAGAQLLQNWLTGL